MFKRSFYHSIDLFRSPPIRHECLRRREAILVTRLVGEGPEQEVGVGTQPEPGTSDPDPMGPAERIEMIDLPVPTPQDGGSGLQMIRCSDLYNPAPQHVVLPDKST